MILNKLDTRMTYYLNTEFRNPFFDFILPLFSEIFLLLLAFFFFYLFIYYTNRPLFKKLLFIFPLLILLSVISTNILSDIIKALADRPRPLQALPSIYYQKAWQWLITPWYTIALGGGSSFLSSHASNSMAIAMTVYLFFEKKHPLIFLFPFLTGWSRIYLGKHYVFDVLAGWALGAFIAYFLFKFINKLLLKHKNTNS